MQCSPRSAAPHIARFLSVLTTMHGSMNCSPSSVSLTALNQMAVNNSKKELCMKLRNINMSVLLVALVGRGFTTPIVAADDEQPNQLPQKVQEKMRAAASNPYVPAAKKLIQARTWGKTDPFAIKMAGNETAAKIRAAAEAVRDAKDS